MWRGRLTVWQPCRGHGYRFNLDSLLLAAFCGQHDNVLDLGSGCGIVALLLLAAGKARRITAVEVQPALAALIQQNAQANGFAAQLQVHVGDLRQLPVAQPAAFDAVVFNPPYFQANAGKPCHEACRDQARNERHGTLRHFVECASQQLQSRGRLYAITRAARTAELHTYLSQTHLHVVQQQAVRARPQASHTQHCLVAAQRQPTAVAHLPPLFVHQPDTRSFSPAVAAWLNGEGF